MNLLKSNFVVGLAAGLVASLLAPMLIPVVRSGVRPLAKSLVRGGMVLYEKSREAVASAGEMLDDVIAEVQAEKTARQGGVVAENAGEDRMTQRMYPEYPDFPPKPYGGNGAGKGAGSPQFERGGPT